MVFEWDENKNDSNKDKHKRDFNNANEVLKDTNHVIVKSNKKDCNEERFVAIGLILELFHSVVFTIRNSNIYRIISFRRSNKKEEKAYKTINENKK